MRRGKNILLSVLLLSLTAIPVRAFSKDAKGSNFLKEPEFYLGSSAFLLGSYLLCDSASIAIRSSLTNHGIEYFGSRFVKSMKEGDVSLARIRLELMTEDLAAADRKGILSYEGRSLLARLRSMVAKIRLETVVKDLEIENHRGTLIKEERMLLRALRSVAAGTAVESEMAEIKTALTISNSLRTKWVMPVRIPITLRVVAGTLLSSAGLALLDVPLNAADSNAGTSFTPQNKEYDLYADHCDIGREVSVVHSTLEPMSCDDLIGIALTSVSEIGPLGYILRSDSLAIVESKLCEGPAEQILKMWHYAKYRINYEKLYASAMTEGIESVRSEINREFKENEANGTNDRWRAATTDYCASRDDILALISAD